MLLFDPFFSSMKDSKCGVNYHQFAKALSVSDSIQIHLDSHCFLDSDLDPVANEIAKIYIKKPNVRLKCRCIFLVLLIIKSTVNSRGTARLNSG